MFPHPSAIGSCYKGEDIFVSRHQFGKPMKEILLDSQLTVGNMAILSVII